MNDTITLYYYTAWDGFAWQGCDEATAKSLQGYMEATKTLPRSSVEEPPFGGAVPCKIFGQIGVAVYRYLTRQKGDSSGRDSLYLALAFIPLDVGGVDFARLLELPQLATPKPGPLHPEEISVSEHNLRLENVTEEPCYWLDGDASVAEYRVLKGRFGLRKLSALFFSKYAQLGFLNAVFRSENGIDDLVASQSYSVYSEVADVVAASKALREARKIGGGILDRSHVAVRRMNDALDQLEGWSERQRGYAGLRAYHAEKKRELVDDGEKVKKITGYVEELRKMLNSLPDASTARGNPVDEGVRYQIKRCAERADEIIVLPVVDHESYATALKLSLEATRCSAKLQGAYEGTDRAIAADKARLEAEADLRKCRQEAEAKSRSDQKEIERLKKALSDLTTKAEKCERQGQGNEVKLATGGEIVLDSAQRRKRPCLPFGELDWILVIIAVLFFSGVMYMLARNVIAENKDEKKDNFGWMLGWQEPSDATNATDCVQTNEPGMAACSGKGEEKPDKENAK